MTRINVLIIDDEADARHLIRQYCDDYEELNIIGECTNGREAVIEIEKKSPDLIFLDVQMPLLNGLQVLQQIIHIPQIIFSTAFDKFALKAFDLNAIDYLLKPYNQERFALAIQKMLYNRSFSNESVKQLDQHLLQATEKYSERLLVEKGNRLIGIRTTDIIWLEAEGDYTKLHTATGQFLSNYGIGLLEKKLNPSLFLRVHRSALVNIHHIAEVYKEPSGPQLLLTSGTVLRVSKSYQDALKQLMI